MLCHFPRKRQIPTLCSWRGERGGGGKEKKNPNHSIATRNELYRSSPQREFSVFSAAESSHAAGWAIEVFPSTAEDRGKAGKALRPPPLPPSPSTCSQRGGGSPQPAGKSQGAPQTFLAAPGIPPSISRGPGSAERCLKIIPCLAYPTQRGCRDPAAVEYTSFL